MTEKLYTIGQMAKICNVSTEQLRHYNKQNILEPKERGKNNNYRYYTESQIEDVLLIKELKKIGLPLKTISLLLRDKNIQLIKTSLENNMYIQRNVLYERQKSYDSLVDTLLSLNNAVCLISQASQAKSSLPTQDFCIVPIAERPIVSTRYNSSCSVEDPFIFRYTELLNIIEKEKIMTSRSIFLLFHDHYRRQFRKGEEAIGDLELFANVTGSVKNTKHYRLFGGFLAACATHIGHYRHTQKVYNELMNWVTNIGYTASGISFQELIVGRTMTDYEESFVTKIYLPLNVDSV